MAPNLFYGPALSVVIASVNRLDRLKRCVAAVQCGTRAQIEILVVGGADDGLSNWAAREHGIRLIEEPRRSGGAHAYNLGLRAACGRFVAWLHDDSRPHTGALDAALRMLKRPDNGHIGCVALFENGKRAAESPDAIDARGRRYGVRRMAGVIVPTFGVARRELVARCGFFDERYYAAAWDVDLALRIQSDARLSVVGCPEALVEHDEVLDERKQTEAAMVARDIERLESKWELARSPLAFETGPAPLLMPSAAAATRTPLVASA